MTDWLRVEARDGVYRCISSSLYRCIGVSMYQRIESAPAGRL